MTGSIEAQCVWPVAALLGEGPLWSSGEAALWFVDIKRGMLHRFTPTSGARESFDVGGRPSFVALAQGGGLVVGNGLGLDRVEGGVITGRIATIAMPAHNRTNDATVDAQGRLWFGTMDDDERAATGRVYRFDSALHEMGGACVITNGPAISPDGRFLYHVDTLDRTIWRFDIAGDPAALEEGERFIMIEDGAGTPDGVSIDAEGSLWVGLWGGWAARRYSPQGTLQLSVALPCANVTKVAFGGADRRTAYITTARIGLDAAALAEQPLAGGLFAVAAPAPGLATNKVVLDET